MYVGASLSASSSVSGKTPSGCFAAASFAWKLTMAGSRSSDVPRSTVSCIQHARISVCSAFAPCRATVAVEGLLRLPVTEPRSERTHAHLERASALHAADARSREQSEERVDVVGPRGERELLLDVIGDGLVRKARGALDVAGRLDGRCELEEVLGPRLAVPSVDGRKGLVHVLGGLLVTQAGDDRFDLVRHR